MKTPSWLRSFRKRLSGHKTSRKALRLEVLEDRLTPAGVFPNDPGFSQQWPLHNTGQTGGTSDADIDMPEAWTVTTGSMATVVAVLDTGVDYTHPDLYLNIWLNESEIPASIAGSLVDSDGDGIFTFRDLNAAANAAHVTDMNANGYIDGGDLLSDTRWENGLDEDGNGRVDDLVGWDFRDDDNDPAPPINDDHGTSVSKLIAAVGNNGVGQTGVMWSARLLLVRIQDNNRDRTNDDAAAGLDYAVAAGATISSNSWGDFTYSQVMYDAIDRARQAGHLFVTSAGNDGVDLDVTPRYPAAYNLDNIVAVMALDANDQKTLNGSWGLAGVDLGAPTPTGANSQATPHVTGVAGLLRTLHPEWTYSQIKAQILSTVDPLASLAGKCVTGGRLNAATALGYTEISISDASAVEGSAALKLIDRFISEAPDDPNLRMRSGTFGPDGNGDGVQYLYIPFGTTSEVRRYDGLTGAFIDTFVGPGSGGLNGPFDLAFGPDGLLYVASYESGEVLRYNAFTGAFIDSIASGLTLPSGLTFGPDGSLYIANEGDDNILRFDGSSLSLFVSAGSGGLDEPRKAVFGPDGNLYVASQGTNQVLRYNGATGAFMNVFTSTAPIVTGEAPMWLAFGADGYLYTTGRTSPPDSTMHLLRFQANTGAFVDDIANPGGWSFVIGADGLVYNSSNASGNFVNRLGPTSLAAFTVSLSAPSAFPVTVDYSTVNGSASAGSDYAANSGTLTFAPGQTSRTIVISTVDNTSAEPSETFSIALSNPVGGTIVDGTGVGTILDNDTKFYVLNDGADQTFEYGSGGETAENYALSSGNTAPRGAASNAAGDKVWVVDANKTVYVYDTSGGLLGSWTAGGLNAQAQVEGIATNGADIWLVDNKQDKVFRYAGAASRLSGSQNAASNFSLNNGNKNPKDIVTDGASLWVVNDSTTDKVFKYSLTGSLQGSWTISTSGATSPTGLTLDPGNPQHLWIVDNGTDRVYQYDDAVSRTSGSQSASTSFALAAGNTNPQGIADPPTAGTGEPAQPRRQRRKERPTATGPGIGSRALDWQSAVDAVFGNAIRRRRR